MTVLAPVGQFKWTDDYSWLRSMTCRNHPTALYYTKNPFNRGLHVIRYPDGFQYEECPCGFSDLAVICDDNGRPVGKPLDRADEGEYDDRWR